MLLGHSHKGISISRSQVGAQESVGHLALPLTRKHKLHRPQRHQQQLQKRQKKTLRDEVAQITHGSEFSGSQPRKLFLRIEIFPSTRRSCKCLCAQIEVKNEEDRAIKRNMAGRGILQDCPFTNKMGK